MQAILEIRDEVNVKIAGLDLTDRKKLVDKFKYEIPGARYTPAVRLGRWDGKVAFFQLGGSTYINLLPEILPFLVERGYEVDIQDVRTPSPIFNFPEITDSSYSDRNWPSGHERAGEPIMLRDYQPEIINTFFNNPQSVQEVATGAGKTIMTAVLSHSCEPWGRTLVIVPNKSLVTQTLADYENLGLDVGVYYGDRKDLGRQHTICTWQSLNNIFKGDGETTVSMAEFIEGVVAVIVDEVHQAKADALKTILSGPLAHVPIRWGLTGTVPKEEYAKISILSTLGPVVGKLSASDLQEAGHLADCHVNIIQLQDHAEYKNYQSELKFLTSDRDRVGYIAKLIERIAQGGNTLILVDRIETGRLLQTELSTIFSLMTDKPDVAFVSGSTKAQDRKDQYDEVATSTNKIIVATYGVAAVGINIPRIFNLVLLEPGKSFVRVIQSIGRGIRRAQDKDHVEIWDVTSSCKFSRRHLTERKKFYTEAKYPFSLEKIDWK
jgi:superfamily II DNA or RNA helicase